jgi:hypothetical protein
MITSERKRINWGLDRALIAIQETLPIIVCLSCETLTSEVQMLMCGHNICKECIRKHSNMAHYRSLIRCEVCFQDTLVGQVIDSIPNTKTIEGFIDIKFCVNQLVNKESLLLDLDQPKEEV